MKIISLSFCLIASAGAFAPHAAFLTSRTAASRLPLQASADSATAIEEALAASKEFGASSPEARAAWDIVEEIDASNRHHKTDDIHTTKKTEAKVEAPVDVPSAGEAFEAANDGGSVDVAAAQKRVKALADAKSASEEFGPTSPEARIAWELVEELAATDSHHKSTGAG